MATPIQNARLIVTMICKTRQLPVGGFKSSLPIENWKTWKKGCWRTLEIQKMREDETASIIYRSSTMATTRFHGW